MAIYHIASFMLDLVPAQASASEPLSSTKHSLHCTEPTHARQQLQWNVIASPSTVSHPNSSLAASMLVYEADDRLPKSYSPQRHADTVTRNTYLQPSLCMSCGIVKVKRTE